MKTAVKVLLCIAGLVIAGYGMCFFLRRPTNETIIE